MTFTEAATLVLRLVGKPLHYKEITDVAIERSLLSHVGKSPEVTMGARLAAQVKKNEKENPLTRVKPGVFALREWDESLIEAGLKDRTPALERIAKAEAKKKDEGDEVVAGEATAEAEVISAAQHTEVNDELLPPDDEERRRAELSAGAKELFESEEDDDQPIFGTAITEAPAVEGDAEDRGNKRRRRRRRGKRRDEENGDDGSEDLPSYTVSDAPATTEEVVYTSEDSALPEEGADASLADALEKALSRYDRAKGAVNAQNLADSLKRAGQGDVGGAGTVLAVVEAERLLAERQGRLPRFRISGHKVALTAWSLDRKATDKYQALTRALRQMEQSTASSLMDQLNRLPQRAFGELVLVLLSRMGLTDVSAVKRPGSHGSELHLAGRMKLFGQEPHARNGAGIPVAVVVRRDGKDIGRERVTELRGALHHYGPAACGWIISAGQVLSGAREEAASPGGSPVTLTGKHELAELCLAHGVGVAVERIECPVVDLALFESLSGR